MKKTSKIVAVAGHFNPLHPGHINMINEARSYGDKLIVIVANDEQAQNKRPTVFMSERDRVEVMNSIKGVDGVILSIDKDANVCDTLRLLRPQVFCSGCSEEHADAVVEKLVCEELEILTIYNVGGGKVNSSSTLLNDYVSSI